MTIRELYEAVPDEHKDDILCVQDGSMTVEVEHMRMEQVPGLWIGRYRSGMIDVIVVY